MITSHENQELPEMLTLCFEGIESQTGWSFGWNLSEFELKLACMLALCARGMDISWNNTESCSIPDFPSKVHWIWLFCILVDIC